MKKQALGEPEVREYRDEKNFASGYRIPSPFPGKRSVKLILGMESGRPFAMLRRSRCQNLHVRGAGRSYAVSVDDNVWDPNADGPAGGACLERARALGGAARVVLVDGRVLVMPAGDSRVGAAARVRACAETVRECFAKGRPIADIIRGFFLKSGAKPAGIFLDAAASRAEASILEEADRVELGTVHLRPLPVDNADRGQGRAKARAEGQDKARGERRVRSSAR